MYNSASITISLIPSRLVDEIRWFRIRRRENAPQLEGAKDKLEELSRALIPIKAELADEEADMHMASDPALRYLLGEIQDAVLDAQDAVESLSTKVYRIIIRQQKQQQQQQQLQVCWSIAPPLSFNFLLHSIKDIEASIDLISRATVRLRSECVGRPKLRPIYHHTSCLASDLYVVGREDDISKILDMLLSSHESDLQREEESYHVSVIAIIGMAGLGKTTLAQFIFHHSKSVDHFDLRIWVHVTVDFNFQKILENIVTSLSHMDCNFRGLSASVLESRVVQLLSGKRFLLVLDDVWNHNYFEWEPLERILRHGGRGSRIVVTSRTSKVSDIMGNQDPYHLGFLSEDDCWQLFARLAFKSTKESSKSWEDLEEIGRTIVAKCRGLPLAVKAMAGLLRGTTDVNKWRTISANKVCLNVEQQNILPALKLSYDRLPSHLKQCFAYCSLFPKGYVFDKKEMVQLWIAEDLIQSTADESCRPEETGSQYFDELLTRSFFRPSSYDDDDEGNDDVRYEMHDLLQELAQLVSGQRFRQVKDSEQCDLSQKVRHVSLLGDGQDVEQPVLQIIDKCKHLRTLMSPSGSLNKYIGTNSLEKMVQTLTCIRSLDLSSSTISKLPKSIKKLKLLRYLDLSRTEISELPDTLCSLYNLQTLKLSGCPSLVKLPKDFSDLINLRHLELDERFWYNCTKLPPRMGRLTSLHNLHVFPVGLENGYGIQELKGMAYLTGTLHISQLENAMKNAAEANLKEKESLEKLVLGWSSTSGDDDQKAHRDETERVLEDLQPHSNLKELQVIGFKGHRFPLWMTDGGRLQTLVSLSFNSCTKCKTLSIGLFPHLKRLSLKRMQALQRLLLSVFDHEGRRQLPGLAIEKQVSNNIETLKIVHCPNLTELPNFPALRDLKIKKCSSIETLPQTQSLESLTLIDNLVLADLNEGSCSSFSKLSELRIVACPKLKALPQVHFAPEKMEIIQCELVRAFPNPGCFGRLRHLAVDDSCYGGGGKRKNIVGEIPDNSCLCSLVISNIPNNVTSFPKWPNLPSLESLHIRHCKDLVSLSDHEEAAPFQGLSSLKLLSIQNCPRLVTLLPINNGGGLPKTLECLTIGSCNSLETLGPEDVLNSLTSLTDLYIENCPKIKRLPKEGVSSSLQHLVIQGCPLLMERCGKDEKGGGGQDWPKIMHIPDLEMEVEASNNNNNHAAADECSKSRPTSPAAAHLRPHLSCGIL